MVVLAEAFQIDTLKIMLSDYFRKILNIKNIEGLIQTIELSHIYKIDDLKETCIKLINQNSILVINSTQWKILTQNYPELILQIFRKK